MFPTSGMRSYFREVPETVLINLAQNGNEAAYQELMQRSWEVCVGVAVSALGDREDALDEVQDAFLKAFIHLATFKQQCKFSTWVVRIVINHCLMHLRKRKRIRLVPYTAVNSSGDEFDVHVPVDKENPEDILRSTELHTVLRCELTRIPVFLRIPLELRYIHTMELEDVARQLNISVAAAKSRLHRAQVFLKDRMLKHCGERGLGTLSRVIQPRAGKHA